MSSLKTFVLVSWFVVPRSWPFPELSGHTGRNDNPDRTLGPERGRNQRHTGDASGAMNYDAHPPAAAFSRHAGTCGTCATRERGYGGKQTGGQLRLRHVPVPTGIWPSVNTATRRAAVLLPGGGGHQREHRRLREIAVVGILTLERQPNASLGIRWASRRASDGHDNAAGHHRAI